MKDVFALIELKPAHKANGQVIFRATNPVTNVSMTSIFVTDVEQFCAEEDLIFDRELIDYCLNRLDYQPSKGWFVPNEHVKRDLEISSSQAYLKKMQEEIF